MCNLDDVLTLPWSVHALTPRRIRQSRCHVLPTEAAQDPWYIWINGLYLKHMLQAKRLNLMQKDVYVPT